MPGVVASVVEGEGGVDPEVPALAYGEGEDDNEPESIQKLLEPLSKEQLINLLSEAAGKHADLMERVNQVVDEDPVHRKIFVHGLGWETTVDTLASFFRQYGVIEDSNVVCDKVSGKSKGYGFILFKHRTGARRALKNPQKKIGNRMTACQMASAGPAPAPPLRYQMLQFFAKYGEIEEGPLGLDKLTGKPKGFALFVYKTPDGARKALEEPHKNFDGHILHCQKAIDGPKPSKLGLQSHNRGLHHGAAGGGAQGSHLTRGETASFGVGGHLQSASLGHLMAPANTGLGYKKGSASGAASGSGFNPGFGQNLAPLLANPGAGLGLPMGSLLVNSGARGMQGAYGNQPAGIAGNVNPGMMGTYGGHTPIQGGYGNPMMAHGAGRGKHATGHRGGVSHYMP
ncbi:unnamed protein product [Spirodela intermedia]|uniref:RRM domain-containing protein n=1 Tax=Spirodela intermedia TaxID=51605 RepID=A0A7I8IH19_SPIIN|nr:unnamed protein product [Spirodela intermedia]CAA6657003.1 unnamed protein product [Spirodela intermedia]